MDYDDEMQFQRTNIFIFNIEENSSRMEVTNACILKDEKRFHKKHKIILNNGWDIFKLLNFLSYIPDEYYSDKIKTTQKEGFDKCLKILKNDEIYFEVFVTKGLERQEIYITKWTNWIHCSLSQIDGKYYIKKIPWSLEKNNNHPLCTFGKYFGKVNRAPSQIIHSTFKGLFKRHGKFQKDPREKTNLGKLECLIENLPGYIEVRKQNNINGGLFLDENVVLNSLIWVCAWGKNRLIEQTHYLELDASFRSSDPYCYCCVNSIYYNESIPIVIVIQMKETFHLYEDVFLAMESFGINRELLNSIPILTDMGKGLIKFGEHRNLKHFFCHRHIIEAFGHPVLKNWVTRLLECTTKELYYILCPQISEEISIWCSQQAEEHLFIEKLLLIQAMIDPQSSHPIYNYKKWAIWERLQYHIGRCSNHSESLHHVFNMNCPKNLSIIERIVKICKIIIRRFTNQTESHGRSIKKNFGHIRILSQKQKQKIGIYPNIHLNNVIVDGILFIQAYMV